MHCFCKACFARLAPSTHTPLTPPRRTVKASARIPLTRAPAVLTQLVMEEVLVSEGLSVTRAMSGDAALELLRYSVFR